MFGVTINQIPKPKYEVNPEDFGMEEYVKERRTCVTMPSLGTAALQSNLEDNAVCLLQFNHILALHIGAARTFNTLRREELNKLKAKDIK